MRYNSTPGIPHSHRTDTTDLMIKKPEARHTRRAFLALSGALAMLTLLPAAANDAPLQIWFIRHVQSVLNVPGTALTVPDRGVSYPLTRHGMEQARTLAESLSGAPIRKVYTSTHLRAIQTADAIALDHLLPLQLDRKSVV